MTIASPQNLAVLSPTFLTVDQVAERLYVGRSTAYNLISAGEIAAVRFGRLIRVPASALDAYVSNKLQAGFQGKK